MLKLSKDAPVEDHGVVQVQTAEGDGYTANVVTFAEKVDHRPLFKGLPDDSCQCPHWGYVVKGKLTFPFADREEVFEAGDCLLRSARPYSVGRSRQRVHPVQPYRGAEGNRGGDDEEHAGDAGRLSATEDEP